MAPCTSAALAAAAVLSALAFPVAAVPLRAGRHVHATMLARNEAQRSGNHETGKSDEYAVARALESDEAAGCAAGKMLLAVNGSPKRCVRIRKATLAPRGCAEGNWQTGFGSNRRCALFRKPTLAPKDQARVCDHGFHLEDGKCEVNTCTCDNGGKAEGKYCETHGKHICMHCKGGYHFDTEVAGLCVENLCTCAHGHGKKGGQCSTDKAAECEKCDFGFKAANLSCIENVCTCANGNPKSSGKCSKDQAVECNTCDSGYNRDTSLACIENVCTCANGSPKSGGKCSSDQAEQCKTCDAGYKRVSLSCIEKECKCTNGALNTAGGTCTQEGTQNCMSCHAGHQAGGNMKLSCVELKCTCSNGRNATGTACTAHGAEDCVECEDGHFLQGEQGDSDVKTCEDCSSSKHGEHCVSCDAEKCIDCVTGHFADENGECKACSSEYRDQCVSCDKETCTDCGDDYFARNKDGKCKLTQCTCKNGTPANGTDCTKHNAVDCEDCNKEYYLEGDDVKKCKACSLKYGTQCVSCDSNTCIDCGDGQFADGDNGQCKANQCTCLNGLGASYTLCKTNGAEQCKVCSAGFHLTPADECEAYICTCDGGVASDSCHESWNFASCASCSDGYFLRSSYSTCEHCTTVHGPFCNKCDQEVCTEKAQGHDAHAATTAGEGMTDETDEWTGALNQWCDGKHGRGRACIPPNVCKWAPRWNGNNDVFVFKCIKPDDGTTSTGLDETEGSTKLRATPEEESEAV